jgi:hypothetical protein
MPGQRAVTQNQGVAAPSQRTSPMLQWNLKKLLVLAVLVTVSALLAKAGVPKPNFTW